MVPPNDVCSVWCTGEREREEEAPLRLECTINFYFCFSPQNPAPTKKPKSASAEVSDDNQSPNEDNSNLNQHPNAGLTRPPPYLKIRRSTTVQCVKGAYLEMRIWFEKSFCGLAMKFLCVTVPNLELERWGALQIVSTGMGLLLFYLTLLQIDTYRVYERIL